VNSYVVIQGIERIFFGFEAFFYFSSKATPLKEVIIFITSASYFIKYWLTQLALGF